MWVNAARLESLLGLYREKPRCSVIWPKTQSVSAEAGALEPCGLHVSKRALSRQSKLETRLYEYCDCIL